MSELTYTLRELANLPYDSQDEYTVETLAVRCIQTLAVDLVCHWPHDRHDRRHTGTSVGVLTWQARR